MPQFTKTKTFSLNESPLASADLNSIGNDLQTFLNTTKLDADNIQTGALTGTLLAAGTIAPAKLTTTTPGYLIIGPTTTGVPTYTAVSGDIAITGAGVVSITTDSIVNADVNSAAAIAYSKLNLGTSILNADVSTSAAIAVSKLAAGTSAQVLLNTATPTPTWTTLSGDVTVGATGTTAVGDNKIASRQLSATSGLALQSADVQITTAVADVTGLATGTITPAINCTITLLVSVLFGNNASTAKNATGFVYESVTGSGGSFSDVTTGVGTAPVVQMAADASYKTLTFAYSKALTGGVSYAWKIRAKNSASDGNGYAVASQSSYLQWQIIK